MLAETSQRAWAQQASVLLWSEIRAHAALLFTLYNSSTTLVGLTPSWPVRLRDPATGALVAQADFILTLGRTTDNVQITPYLSYFTSFDRRRMGEASDLDLFITWPEVGPLYLGQTQMQGGVWIYRPTWEIAYWADLILWHVQRAPALGAVRQSLLFSDGLIFGQMPPLAQQAYTWLALPTTPSFR